MKTSGIKLSDIRDPVLRARLAGNLPATVKTDRPILRQDAKPNKTEIAFEIYLKASYTACRIYRQGMTLKLGNGVRYTPDFMAVPCNESEAEPIFFEVKGFMRDDAGVKIKWAAHEFPFWVFVLVRARDRSLRSWIKQTISA